MGVSYVGICNVFKYCIIFVILYWLFIFFFSNDEKKKNSILVVLKIWCFVFGFCFEIWLWKQFGLLIPKKSSLCHVLFIFFFFFFFCSPFPFSNTQVELCRRFVFILSVTFPFFGTNMLSFPSSAFPFNFCILVRPK